jgi:hypothetical protein
MDQKEKPMDQRWSRYPETVLHFTDVMVDLRIKVEQPVKDGLKALGLNQPFGILTPYNPRGVDSPASDNARRMQEMQAELKSSGDFFVELDACSPDKSHCECSVALVADRARVIDIAKRWEQIAIFWFDGDSFWIYGAITNGSLKLPVAE